MVNKPIRKKLGISICLAITAFQAPSVMAQLEEVVVTAERREQSVQDVPVAVSAFDEQTLQEFQIETTLDLVNIIPNLFGGNNTGLGTANMYYLRAQGNDESIATFDPAVGTYVDDVYVTRQNANNFAFFDVERIEVLRGPQGTLFGRNTTGGAINVILKKPGEEFSGFAEVGYGRFDEYLGRATVDMPFSESVLTKFSAFIIKDDGWLNNTTDGGTYNDVDMKGFRGALRYLASDNVIWDLSVDYMETNAANVDGDIIGDDRFTSTVLPGGLPPIPGWVQKADYGNDTETLSVVSNLGFDLGAGRTSLILGYRDLSQDFLLNFPGPVPGPGNDDFFWIDNTGTHEMLTAELKWVANLMDDRMTLVTGVFYLDEDNTTDFADYLFGGLRLADRVLTNGTKSYAVYAQADWKIGEKGTLTVGARFTDEDKDIGLADNTGADVLTTAGLIAAGIPLSQSESKVTPRIAYAYDISDEFMVYASATNGFKSGGWNARGTSPSAYEPFGPEEIWSYEIGMRAEWLDGTLRTNITAFYSEVEDLQTTAATPSGQFLTTNAGGLENKGLEAEITWLPIDIWKIFASVGLQDAKYVDLPEGCTVPNTSFAGYDRNCNPAVPKRAPDTTITLGTSVDFGIGGGLVIRPFGNLRYISENFVGTSSQGFNSDVTIYNAGIALVGSEGTWQATLECTNCSDEEYVTSFLFNDYFTPPGRWQARVRWNF
ncbi:MAG: TonB-dependent receptor [Xanthomonadales bacterium]|jgi:iron complex outermembrane receptor protein|nr:TonB-dependent receptor [Xanthomonadales bacterium]